MSSAVFAALHSLALAIGLGAVFMRGRFLGQLGEVGARDFKFDKLFFADNLWALAAFMWITTGLMRAFGGLEKGSAWYLQNHMFYLKMALFFVIFLLEIFPMLTFIGWRIRLKRGLAIDVQPPLLKTLRRFNHLQLILIFVIPFVASMMARGIGGRLF
jgi:putative membrane protein